MHRSAVLGCLREGAGLTDSRPFVCPPGAAAAALAALAAFLLLAAALAGAEPPDSPQPRASSLTPWSELARIEYERRSPDELAAFLRHADPGVRRQAALAAARLAAARLSTTGRVRPDLSGSSLASRLLPLLADPDSLVRERAAFALGQLRDSTAVDPLAAAALDPELRVAAQAAEALGRIGGPAASAHLARLLADPSPRRRAAAAAGLARLADSTRAGDLAAALATEQDPGATWKLIYALEKTPRHTPSRAILPHLGAPSPLVRAAAARTLGKLGDSTAADALAATLANPEWRVRANAARAMGEIRAATGVPALAARLRDPVHHVREAAATSIGQLAGRLAGTAAARDLEEPLVAASTDSAAGVRRAAVTALGAIFGPHAAPTLRTRVDDPSPQVAAAALEAYAAAAGEAAAAVLVDRLDPGQPAPVRVAAVSALATRRPPGAERTLGELLADEDWVVAATAAEALGELGEPGDARLETALAAASERRSGFEESDVRLAALGALARLGGPGSLPAFRRALAAPDPRERAAARAALDSLAARGVALDKKLRQDAENSEKEEQSMPVGSAPAFLPLAEPPSARRARIVTPRGAIELELLSELAPMAVESFVELARSGFYARAVFHRVVPNFVIQGGCPRGDGWGGPGYALRSEISPESYGVGTVGMADSGLETAGSQFFITHSPQPHLDGRYTVFARVVAGMGVVDRIQQGDPFRVELIEGE